MDNLKEKINKIVDKIKNDKDFANKFKENPVKALEELSGIEIPEDKSQEAIAIIQTKINSKKVDDALDKLKGLFK